MAATKGSGKWSKGGSKNPGIQGKSVPGLFSGKATIKKPNGRK